VATLNETMRELALDDPGRAPALVAVIRSKPALKAWYEEMYARYVEVLARCPADGLAIEIGSGAGFARDVVPGLATTDVLPYSGVDQVVDACHMPFADGDLRFIGMLNVFHHVPDVEAFLREAERCVRPGGRCLVLDQHPGWIGGAIFKYAHHEGYDPTAREWRFESSGPLSGANGALAWIVFRRDRDRLARLFPRLKLVRYETHSPLRYWLAGGLKPWSLLPGWGFGAASALDRALVRMSAEFGSFSAVEIERV
jgi:SAM-dependent methyltransferase